MHTFASPPADKVVHNKMEVVHSKTEHLDAIWAHFPAGIGAHPANGSTGLIKGIQRPVLSNQEHGGRYNGTAELSTAGGN